MRTKRQGKREEERKGKERKVQEKRKEENKGKERKGEERRKGDGRRKARTRDMRNERGREGTKYQDEGEEEGEEFKVEKRGKRGFQRKIKCVTIFIINWKK